MLYNAVRAILDYLTASDSEADILAQYPGLESEDIRACLQFAADIPHSNHEV